MADPTKVYGGSIPQGGFDAEQAGAGFSTVNEAENSGQFGGPAGRPGTVNEGGSTQAKTGTGKNDLSAFLQESSYKGDMSVGRPTSGATVNPNDVSHADNC